MFFLSGASPTGNAPLYARSLPPVRDFLSPFFPYLPWCSVVARMVTMKPLQFELPRGPGDEDRPGGFFARGQR